MGPGCKYHRETPGSCGSFGFIAWSKQMKNDTEKKSRGDFNLSPRLIPTPLNGDLDICESILLSFWDQGLA